MLIRFAIFFLLLSFVRCEIVNAKDYFLTIGGGYTPSSNQASLEKNVLYYQRMLQHQFGDQIHHDIFFSDGDAPDADLQVMDRASVPIANRLMAEFFANTKGLGLSYRDHQIDGVRGSTDPANIREWFETIGPTMLPGDRLVIYVTSHGKGSRDDDHPYNTSIATWENRSISVSQLAEMLDGLPDEIQVMTVMVQCHAGGFARLVYRQGDPDKGLSPQQRIGFFATVHDRPAAGCTPEIDEANYAEYSSYFWAALFGRNRMGEPIDPPDYNQDGYVSFDEAHAYTILVADTIDLPITTSDEFLQATSTFGNGDDSLMSQSPSYATLLKYANATQTAVLDGLSQQLDLTGDDRIAEVRRELKRQRGSRRGRSFRRPKPSDQLRLKIARDTKKQWPGLENVLNPIAIELMTTRSDEFVNAIQSHSDYHRYRQANEDANSSPQKTRVKYERFLRTIEHVILAENLRQQGDREAIEAYEAMKNAESGTLFDVSLD